MRVGVWVLVKNCFVKEQFPRGAAVGSSRQGGRGCQQPPIPSAKGREG